MTADALLSVLGGVRRTGAGRWVARCPSHEDRAPSLSVRELPDGRVLLHCFAGCPTHDVLGAVGLDFAALFPEGQTAVGMAMAEAQRDRPRPGLPTRRLGFAAADVLLCVRLEAALAATLASDVARGRVLPEDELARLWTAAGRLAAAAEAVHGR